MAKIKRIGNPRILGEQAYITLKEAIISGQFPPGNWLAEDQLTQVMGISRTPLREAFKKLQSEGLIEIFPRRGAYIVGLTLDDIKDLFEAREILETEFFIRSARRIGTEEVDRFRRSFKKAEEEMAKAGKDRSLVESSMKNYLKVDRSFHDKLVKASGNSYWLKLYLNIRDRMQIFGYKMGHMAEQMPHLSRQHNAILDAVSEKQFSKAKKRLREHIRYVRDVFLKIA